MDNKTDTRTLSCRVGKDLYYRIKQYIAGHSRMRLSDFLKEAVKEKLEKDVTDVSIMIDLLTEVKRLLNRLDTKQTYAHESFVLYIETFFANNPRLPEEIRETMRLQSAERTELFFKALRERLRSGQSTMGKLLMQFIEGQSG